MNTATEQPVTMEDLMRSHAIASVEVTWDNLLTLLDEAEKVMVVFRVHTEDPTWPVKNRGIEISKESVRARAIDFIGRRRRGQCMDPEERLHVYTAGGRTLTFGG